MKATQKLILTVENITIVVKFSDLDQKLLPLVSKLEETGDIFGPVSSTVEYSGGLLFVSIGYADKSRGPVKQTIFGIEEKEFCQSSTDSGSLSALNI